MHGHMNVKKVGISKNNLIIWFYLKIYYPLYTPGTWIGLLFKCFVYDTRLMLR